MFKFKNKNKLILLFLPFFLLSIFIANKERTIDSIANTINKRMADDNIYQNAKVDPLYKVKILRKTGSDKDKINLLFLGDNYSQNINDELFSNYVYNEFVEPALSTKTPDDSSIAKSERSRGVRIPFQTFLNDKINIYTIQPNYGEVVSSIRNNHDTFFGMNLSSKSERRLLSLKNFGHVKKNILQYDVTKNFLEDGGVIGNNSLAVIRNGGEGRANAELFSHFLSTTENGTSVFIHEMSHSIWGLSDEYSEGDNESFTGPNRCALNNDSEIQDRITWKEFLNFRGIGAFKPNPKENSYVPTRDCIMGSLKPEIDFCEVCTHRIIKNSVKGLQRELFYIADPELQPHEGRPEFINWTYSIDYLQKQELYKENISTAKSKHLQFRTVIDNLTSKPRKIKLKVNIINLDNKKENVFEEESEIFTLEPGQLKGLLFSTNNKAPNNLSNNKYEAIGLVIDAETNEVLATNLDRKNYYYLNNKDNKKDKKDLISSYGKNTYNVTINFLDKNNNQPLPDIKPTQLVKRDGTKFKLEKILFNGYKLDSSKSKIDNNDITISGKDLTFNYYYDKLKYKELKLKLIDPNKNNQIVQEKTIKVYEGQTFRPSSSDFFIYDLSKFNNENSNYNETWNESVVFSDGIYHYENISNKNEITYCIKNSPTVHHFSKDIKIIQGDKNYNMKYLSGSTLFSSGSFDNGFNRNSNSPLVINNNVDISKIGNYELLYLHKGSISDIKEDPNSVQKIKVEVVKNEDPSYKPDIVSSEVVRLNNYDYIVIDDLEYKEGKLDDFEKINKSNLLSKIKYLNLNNDECKYEVIDFSKRYPGVDGSVFYAYKFKVKVTSKIDSSNSSTTKEFEKTIWLNTDDSRQLQNVNNGVQEEINRINKLDLRLQKSGLTQDEINNINQQNILNNISNWVSISNFAYEVINFKNYNSQFKFNIKVSKDNISINSKEFALKYTIINLPEDEKTLLDKEIKRINLVQIYLVKNTFSQNEIDNINANNLTNYITNWNQIAINDKYKYEIINLTKHNNRFTFSVKVNLKKDVSISKITNQFNLSYTILINKVVDVDNKLELEKYRINNLNLKLKNKNLLTQDEISDINNNPEKIIEYLSNWEPNNLFQYKFIISNTEKNKIELWIQINKTNDNLFLTSKKFVFNYDLVSDSELDNNPSNSNNNLQVILISTLVPSSIACVIGGSIGYIHYKKRQKNNK
ncbi:MAG: hypothetical protein HDR43_02300 [Mycoplasma sp.]|nr:hypothetical protein [Mycoplasma sp.]